jgi:hypothetical protein
MKVETLQLCGLDHAAWVTTMAVTPCTSSMALPAYGTNNACSQQKPEYRPVGCVPQPLTTVRPLQSIPGQASRFSCHLAPTCFGLTPKGWTVLFDPGPSGAPPITLVDPRRSPLDGSKHSLAPGNLLSLSVRKGADPMLKLRLELCLPFVRTGMSPRVGMQGQPRLRLAGCDPSGFVNKTRPSK